MANTEALDLLQRQSARRPDFFAERGLDQMFAMVIELAAETWVLRERLYAIEDIAGISRERIERWQPTPAQAEELAAMRHAMMKTLFRTIDTGLPPVSYEGETADPIPPGTEPV